MGQASCEGGRKRISKTKRGEVGSRRSGIRAKGKRVKSGWERDTPSRVKGVVRGVEENMVVGGRRRTKH